MYSVAALQCLHLAVLFLFLHLGSYKEPCLVCDMSLSVSLNLALQVVQYLAGCGLQSCVMLVRKGYPDIGWNPVEGERYLDFLRFAVFCNGDDLNRFINPCSNYCELMSPLSQCRVSATNTSALLCSGQAKAWRRTPTSW